MLTIPGENAFIVVPCDQLFLQPCEGIPTFSIDQRHVYVEQTKQAVRLILHQACVSICRPAHLGRDVAVLEVIEILNLDTCTSRYLACQA